MAVSGKTKARAPAVNYLRWLGYAYLLLLIFEGALRKWFLPSLSEPLLLAREPVVLAAYAIAIHTQRFPLNRYLLAGLALMVFWFAITFIAGHGNPFVAAFGIRANYLHFPFAFIMGAVFDREDVIRIGRWWLIGSIGMTFVIAAQFYSPQSAWINQGVGGTEGAGFGATLGRYRPPGTFSFIVGVVWFYTFATAFLISAMTQHQRYAKWILAASALAICVAVPVSISRTLILSAALTLLTGVFVSGLQNNALLRFGRILFFVLIGLLAASQLPVFEDAKEAWRKGDWEHGRFQLPPTDKDEFIPLPER